MLLINKLRSESLVINENNDGTGVGQGFIPYDELRKHKG